MEQYLFKEETGGPFSPWLIWSGALGPTWAEARRLQQLYKDRIDIFVAFESEAYPGALDKAPGAEDPIQPRLHSRQRASRGRHRL